jgi:hypothetical protein
VQDINGIGPRSDIDHPKRTSHITHANFPDPWADALHRFPVVWIETALNPFELEAGVVPRILGKSTKPFQ